MLYLKGHTPKSKDGSVKAFLTRVRAPFSIVHMPIKTRGDLLRLDLFMVQGHEAGARGAQGDDDRGARSDRRRCGAARGEQARRSLAAQRSTAAARAGYRTPKAGARGGSEILFFAALSYIHLMRKRKTSRR